MENAAPPMKITGRGFDLIQCIQKFVLTKTVENGKDLVNIGIFPRIPKMKL